MVRFQDTAGSLSRRRAQTWRDLFIAPCASLRPRWMTFLNILHDPGFNTLNTTADWTSCNSMLRLKVHRYSLFVWGSAQADDLRSMLLNDGVHGGNRFGRALIKEVFGGWNEIGKRQADQSVARAGSD